MPALVSPLSDPATWAFSIALDVTIANGLRYAGYRFRGLRATHAPDATVAVPALGILHQASGGGKTFVEVQLNPFPIRRVAAAFPWGLPVIYLVFDDATGITFTDGDTAAAGEALRNAGAVTIVMASQDRTVLDPALWAAQITAAIDTGSGNSSEWEPFATAVAGAVNTGASAPVLVLDHAGRPRTAGDLDIVFGAPGAETVHHVSLDPADAGDLQRTVARVHGSDPSVPANLWGAATSFRLRPAAADSLDVQLVRLEDRLAAIREITVTPAQRHIAFTNLNGWFAAQFATPDSSGARPERFTRGNRIRPLVNGPEFFDELFRELQTARSAGLGFHLAGWAMLPEFEFTRRRDGDPTDLALTLRQAAERIGAGGGMCRFLPAQFIQLEPGHVMVDAEALIFYSVMALILVTSSLGWAATRTDGTGAVILMLAWIGSIFYTEYLFSTGGRSLEQNKAAVDVLNAISNSASHFSPYPAINADNTVAPDLTGFPFDTLFTATRHFGVYHQKFSIVRNAGGYIGYCGGIDLNSDRMDDANHLAVGPFHDVHLRVEGPAVHDLALTFEQRWHRDGGGAGLAFATPPTSVLGTPGQVAAQVARTYFAPAAPARHLEFAPSGDCTLGQTMIQAIGAAREFIYIEDQYLTPPTAYRDALRNKVASGDIRRLIISVPGLTDQPFGELVRSAFITELRTADSGRGIVQVGYPRRRFTLAANDLRASSGRCLLGEDMSSALPPTGGGIVPTIVLGPKARVPNPPFWVAVEGELMWVYDESGSPPPDSNKMRFLVERGDQTRLLAGGSAPKGGKPRNHKAGAAATVIDLTNIYVHAKMMIVDDVFLSIGSANLNRRGLCHDGEINVFTVPEALKAAPANPIPALRRRLWAEMLDLPADMAAGILDDPLAASQLFGRSWLAGNRYTDLDAYPAHIMRGATTGDGLIANLIQGAGFTVIALDHNRLFDCAVDPSSAVESSL